MNWSSKTENVLSDWYVQCHANRVAHAKASASYKVKYYIIGIPAILITALASAIDFTTFSCGDGAFISCKTVSGMSIATACLAAIGAGLMALHVFFKYGEQKREHERASVRYTIVERTIVETLALPRKDRGSPSVVFRYLNIFLMDTNWSAPGFTPDTLTVGDKDMVGDSDQSDDEYGDRGLDEASILDRLQNAYKKRQTRDIHMLV